MKCPSCHSENEETAETCSRCGQGLGAVVRPGSVLASRYEIAQSLGKGGMGMVYKAHDRVLEEEIAIKVLRADVARSPEMARRFRSEIRLARKVTHRNVCRIHEYGEDQGLRYISMELIEGIDLKQVLREQKTGLPPEEAYDVAVQVARGLQAIHEVGIIHRDLKTANIMRDARGVVKLMDFGIAKQEGGTSATAAGDIVGTPEYMSPEQARGQSVDARSDLYALAVVIYEVFSGDVPFRGDTPIVTIFKHIQDQPLLEGAGAPPFPTALVPVLRKGLAKSPDDRFASADEIADALRAARPPARPVSSARPATPAPPAPEDTPPPTLPITQIPTPAGAAAHAPREPSPAGGVRPGATPHVLAQPAAAWIETPLATPPTPPPVTPTPQPRPIDAVETAAPSLPTPAPLTASPPRPAAQEPLAPASPVATPPATGRHARDAARPAEGSVRAVRQQTQRLPAPVAARPPTPAHAVTLPPLVVTPGRRWLLPTLVVIPLLVMGAGILLVGRVLKLVTEPGVPSPNSVASAQPPATPAPQVRRPTPEVTTVRRPAIESASPAVPDLRAAQTPPPAVSSPAGAGPLPETNPPVVTTQPAPRPGVRAAVATPPPRPTEANPEQLRAQQAATTLSQADAAFHSHRYEDAVKLFDDALKLDASSAPAASGKARAQWAVMALRRVFRLGATNTTAIKAGKGPAGFDTTDVETKSQDFHCLIDIEITPPVVRPGDNYDYVAKVGLTSDGKKTIKVKSLQANVTQNGSKTSPPVAPLVKEVPVNQRLTIAEVTGAWSEGMTAWSLELVVTGDKGDTCRNVLRWQ